jgi:hypothetical protein
VTAGTRSVAEDIHRARRSTTFQAAISTVTGVPNTVLLRFTVPAHINGPSAGADSNRAPLYQAFPEKDAPSNSASREKTARVNTVPPEKDA